MDKLKALARKVADNKGPITTHLMVAAGTFVGLVAFDKFIAKTPETGDVTIVEGDLNIEVTDTDPSL